MVKNRKILALGIISLSAASLFITGCKKEEVKLKNGKKAVTTLEDVKILSDALYTELKNKYGISVLVDMIDHKLFDEKYKTTDEENEYVENQITQLKSNYGDNDATFLSAIKSYFGANDEDELKIILALEYKRKEAVIDHLASEISDTEIKTYYDENISGKITAKHILIKPETTDSMSTTEKEAAEEKALKEAKDIIKKLESGKKFDNLAKKYSDDSANADDGGKLEEFDHNSSMDDAFFKAAKDLKEKTYTSEPVKSEYGYHIIYKEKEEKKPTQKKMKKEIGKILGEDKLNADSTLYYQSLVAIREKKNIKFQDDLLKEDYDKLMDDLVNGNN